MNLKKQKLFFSLLLILVAIKLPVFSLNLDVSTLLTIFSLLFAILLGFFIATATTNYLRLQSLIAEEDSSLIILFNLVRKIEPQSVGKVINAIDNYAIAALSFEAEDYVDKTRYEFENFTKEIDAINFSDKNGEELFSSLHGKKNELYRVRQEIALVARRIVTSAHWVVIISLGILVGFLTLTLRHGELLSGVISGILLASDYLLLTLLYEVDNNRFLEQALSYQNSQQIFEAIGRPPYYLADTIKSGRISKPNKSYRTGYYKSFKDNDIKLVDIVKK